jgi:putative DNA primase/helicase
MNNVVTLSETRKAKRKDRGNGGEVSDHDLVLPPGEPMPNVRLFLKAHYTAGDSVLLIQQGGMFYRYDGTCWPSLEDPILKAALYKFFEDKLYVYTDSKGKTEYRPFAPTQRKTADLFDAAKAITIIETATPTPSWRRQNKYPANEVVSCSNGLVHWPTSRLLPHSPDFYIHHSVPFAFDATAPAPAKWLAFLNELWGNDTESIATLQELFGYCVSGDTSQQKMFLMVGPKRGGKGTIARVLGRMLGHHNVAAPTLASLGTNFGLQDLIDKPVAVISDARLGSKSDSSLIAERLLSISGEDHQNVDRKFLPPWSGFMPTRFIILSNELPRFTDASGALASRFIVLMLSQSFYGREKPGLTDELCAELPGIFNWALDGLQLLRARGRFAQPSSSNEAIQELEDLSSPIGAFVRDRCNLGPSESIERDQLYKAYQQWCLDHGHKAVSDATFGRDLRAAASAVRPFRPRTGVLKRPKYYAGIRLLTDHDVFSTMDGHRDHYDHGHQMDAPVTVVTVTKHCSEDVCAACDGKGCPTCKPEKFGLKPRKALFCKDTGEPL